MLDRFRITADNFLIHYERFRIEINFSAFQYQTFFIQNQGVYDPHFTENDPYHEFLLGTDGLEKSDAILV